MVELSRYSHLVLEGLEFIFLVFVALHLPNEFDGVELSIFVAAGEVDLAEPADRQAVVDLIF